MRRFGFVLICLLSWTVAGYALIAYGFHPLSSDLHPQMRQTFELHKPGIYSHIFAAAVALLAGPWQFMPSLRASRPRLHRWLGRIYLLIGVGVGGVSALYMSWFAFGGAVSTAGFGSGALVWLYTGVQGYRSALRREWAHHRRWMVRSFAMALAAVTLRLCLGLGIALGWPFEVFYPALAWLSWVPNAIVAEYMVRTRRGEPGAATDGGGMPAAPAP
ncbi:MAG: DUF2306 domain-containing protein [Planctomycetota bacterium]